MRFDRKHKTTRAKWVVSETFPDQKVADAYLHPAANRSKVEFDWVVPKIHRVRKYCREVLGWSDDEVSAVPCE